MSSSQSWSYIDKQTKVSEKRMADIKENIEKMQCIEVTAAFNAYSTLKILSYNIALTRDQRYDLEIVIDTLKPVFMERIQ